MTVRSPRPWAIGLLIGWSAAVGAAPDEAHMARALALPPRVALAVHDIDAGRIRAHVRFLADDLLEGRGPGTRGGDLAARYMATQFALAGLEPAGDDGGYLQRVGFTGVQTLAGTTFALRPAAGPPQALRQADDYVTNNQTRTPLADIDAPIAFVGYGIEAPEFGWNDYAGIDMHGKIALLVVSEPPSSDPGFFKGEALTYYGRWTYKYEEAARRGAVGVLIIHRTDLASYGWEVVRNSFTNEQVYLRDDTEPKLQAASWITLDVARRLFAAAGLNADEMIDAAGRRGFKARELPVRLAAHIESRVRAFESVNVLGLLPGTSPGPPRQAVVYSAHYDHLGIDPAKPGDNIYNGAVDNGTGCAMLLELAHAFAAKGMRPPHPVLFASVTAEEKNLLGSNFLGKHPPIPAANMALDLNFDAVPPIGTPESVSVAGAERTTFYPLVEKTAAAFGFAIEPDAEPGAGHYYRSDHFSFARAGVPAFSVNTGSKFAGHDLAWGREQREDYTANRYHRPGDEYSSTMDFTADAALTKFALVLGWEALAAPEGVEWQPGDEFEAARLRSRKSQ